MKKTTYFVLCIVTALVGCSTSEKKEKPPAAQSSPIRLLTPGPSASGAVNNTSGSATCVGSYTASAKITNSATGTIWFTPPSGTTNATITDSSGLSSPYVSVVQAVRKRDAVSWCETNTVSFPASSSEQYKFYIYVKNTPPPPSSGQVLTLDVQWEP
jgi:hypothetical protein